MPVLHVDLPLLPATSPNCRRPDEGIRFESNNSLQPHENQPNQPPSDHEKDSSLSSTLGPTQDSFVILKELGIEQINQEAGGMTPMFESLQNTFGSDIITGDMWETLDMASNNGFMPWA
jgi:hypothetical protein